MEFRENERKGLMGKVILYLDQGVNMTQYPVNDWGSYKPKYIRQALLTLFTEKELKMILGKIQECETKKTIDYVNIFRNYLTDSNITKIYNYLNNWRSAYFNNTGNWDEFLCGFVKINRKNREKLLSNVNNYLENKLNTDITGEINKYTQNAGKKFTYKRRLSFRKFKKLKKTRKSRH